MVLKQYADDTEVTEVKNRTNREDTMLLLLFSFIETLRNSLPNSDNIERIQ